ncbi:hypothetical protein [Streptomyces sp. NPDC059460]|uniref:hypothetical protein n=1 Tax=Streptomyces sp. NPDC059460 TaxID=3346840 RepID=UPI003681D88F
MDKPRTTPPAAPLVTAPTTASAMPLAALLDAAERIPGAAALRQHSYELLRAGADTTVVDSDDPAVTRAVVHARADTVPSPRAARRHRNLLLDAGFKDVVAEVRTAVLTDAAALPMLTGLAEAARDTGALTAAEASAWTADQRARARTGRLFLALPLFVAAGTAP